jgi:tol-pal system protein YbgF
VALVTALCLSAGAAVAQSNTDLINRLDRIENEMETLNRAVYKGDIPPDGILHGAPDSSNSDSMAVVNEGDLSGQAALEMRVTQLESDLRTVTGTLEQQGFAVQEIQKKLDHAILDMDARLAAMESQMGGVPAPATAGTPADMTGGAIAPDDMPDDMMVAPDASLTDMPQPAAPAQEGALGTITDSPAPSAATTPEGQYEAAFALLRNRQYVEAETALTGFIERNPEHKLVANARYWLGESYYARQEFGLAAKEFAAAYQKDPKGSKGADSLLKLGMTLSALDKKKEACVALQQIEKEYKTGPAVVRAKQEIKRLACTK